MKEQLLSGKKFFYHKYDGTITYCNYKILPTPFFGRDKEYNNYEYVMSDITTLSLNEFERVRGFLAHITDDAIYIKWLHCMIDEYYEIKFKHIIFVSEPT